MLGTLQDFLRSGLRDVASAIEFHPVEDRNQRNPVDPNYSSSTSSSNFTPTQRETILSAIRVGLEGCMTSVGTILESHQARLEAVEKMFDDVSMARAEPVGGRMSTSDSRVVKELADKLVKMQEQIDSFRLLSAYSSSTLQASSSRPDRSPGGAVLPSPCAEAAQEPFVAVLSNVGWDTPAPLLLTTAREILGRAGVDDSHFHCVTPIGRLQKSGTKGKGKGDIGGASD